MSGSRAVVQAPSAASMLADIKKECGIFLQDGQYRQLAGMPDHAIQALWLNKKSLRTLVFFNGDLFGHLLLLTVDNINSFFREAKIGVGGNAKEFLDVLLARQLQQQAAMAPAVVVVAQPAYSPQPMIPPMAYYAPARPQPYPPRFFPQQPPACPVQHGHHHHAHAQPVARPNEHQHEEQYGATMHRHV